ncbi:hypothetical protein H7U37_03040 [Pseudoflavonifractor phocaeensis]|uniref:hypothetical protein n=1 Tax=Pseudoflavonifractor phocaeensis TaxID=1870988 RepID=UPI00195A0BC7|nr:hypothetical protein [Pseudoflavonifractor phocaeensis]MBM6869369.1 hypothetical protein [Pseudoflavonifractor phocaeensis]MBM6937504.1 hypothetical protein [Pseudoflavonifractor phocaeensis]
MEISEGTRKAATERLVLCAAAAGVLWYGGRRLCAAAMPQVWERYGTFVEENRLSGVALTAGVLFLASLAVVPLPKELPGPEEGACQTWPEEDKVCSP